MQDRGRRRVSPATEELCARSQPVGSRSSQSSWAAFMALAAAMLMVLAGGAFGQEPTGIIAGTVVDQSGASVPGAVVEARNTATGHAEKQTTGENGAFVFAALLAGDYDIRVTANGFAPFVARAVKVEINRSARLPIRLAIAGHEEITITATANLVETGSNSLGQTVYTREMTDLPLNGRNFTQLGLLQAGVVPLTQGLVTAGGSIKATQAFAVNGQRPESNNYLLDGVRNVDRMDGGFALKTPVDAIQEFRILTHTAPAEYGSNSGSTVTVITRSGGNDVHGSVYYFGRNDAVDARNFFSDQVEPLKQHQFGATLGGPVKREKAFFFAYYEGFRNRQGVTKQATVPTPAERAGDFSGLIFPPTGNRLVNFITGQPFPDNRLPPQAINPVSKKVLDFYPLGNVSPSLYRATEVARNTNDQGGFNFDVQKSERDQFSARYALSSGSNVNPLSVRGADLPGFPVGDDLTTQSATVAHTHVFSPRVVNTGRLSFFRHSFLFDKRLNRESPRSLGFNYDGTLDVAQGPPYFIITGYGTVGNPITGPRDSHENNYAVADSISVVRGTHLLKVGGEFRRTQINILQGIASNGFFVFVPFPTNSSFANFLLGAPVVFFQAGGDFRRGLRTFSVAGYAQDEWRVRRNFTINYGVRYEINSPFSEIRDRLNEFRPGVQSTVQPNAPRGVLFPGDAGVAKRIADIYYKGFMPRTGFAWDPRGDGRMSVRASYGIFYDPMANGSSMPMQAAVSALPYLQAVQLGGPALNYTDPWRGTAGPFAPNYFPAPATMLTEEAGSRPPYAQDWNFSIQRALPSQFVFEARYVGTKGTRLPRFIEGNPTVFTPGSPSNGSDAARLYANCPGGRCQLSSVGLMSYSTNSTYHAMQLTLNRKMAGGLSLNTSYWLSKTLDYVSSMNVAGSAPRLVSGENDLAQNPFNLAAEHGPSLFDARHRFTFSGSWEVPFGSPSGGFARAVLAGWQLNAIASVSSGTPFTVYDSANVAQQGQAPEITGFPGSRPDVVSDPNAGPHTPDRWVNPAAFRRLDPVGEAGRFGNEGRNVVRGPGHATLDLSLMKGWRVAERGTLQFRFEGFNVMNHANFGIPVNDLQSPNFGRILEAGSPRVFQLALKYLF